jgi:AraC-like DNA-binding protein
MTVAILYQVAEIIKSAGRQDQGMNHKISSCRHLINSNLANPQLNVQYLAKRLGCNADYLSHLFLSKVGVPLTEFINTRRTQVAISLLNSENMNISEVAYACGYSDPGYFSRIFRRLTGKSPGEFRKQPADNVF